MTPAYAYTQMTDILARAPLEKTETSLGFGLATGLDAGSVHTTISSSDNTYDVPEALIGGVAEVNASYAISLPMQLYTAIEFAFDGRSTSANLDTGSTDTSHSFKVKSTYNGTISGGWLFNRGDILYFKAGLLRSKIERQGAASLTTGANFDRSYRDTGKTMALGFMMPTDQNTYFRYELTRTPSLGEFSNQLSDQQGNNSVFNYKGSSLGFKVGYNFFFNHFLDNPKSYNSLQVNGPYAMLGLQYQNAQLDFQNKIPFAEGRQTRVEKFVRPASSSQYSYHLGYSTGFNSQNLYLAVDYQSDHLLGYNKLGNHFNTEQENFYYRPYRAKTYSVAFGYRPHPSDLLFARVGSTELEIHRLGADNLQNITNKTLNKGTLLGLGFETSLNNFLSWIGEYDFSMYKDSKTRNNTVSPSNHVVALGLAVRL